MARIMAFVGLLAFTTICSSAPREKLYQNVGKVNIEVHTVESIQEFQQKHAMLKLTPLARVAAPGLRDDTPTESSDGQSDDIQGQNKVNYVIGARINGDRLVAQDGVSDVYPTLQDVQVDLQYPAPDAEPGSGAIITYVEISVAQSSDIGNAWISEGGIGQRNIKIVLEIGSTSYFSLVANIYGY